MQEKESIVVVRCELKILSLGITVWHHEACSYPDDGIFNPHLTTIKDSYNQGLHSLSFCLHLFWSITLC